MENILFINSVQEQCGVYQYAKRTCAILKKSFKYNFIYREVGSENEFLNLVHEYKPLGVIYNYHPLTMAWFTGVKVKEEKHYQVHHEGSHFENLKPDHFLYVDLMIEETGNKFALPRPLFEGFDLLIKPQETLPIISSFGFGFGAKNYGSIVKMVNDQFDEAVIRLHIPRAYYGDMEGEATAQILPGILNEMHKPHIHLELSHNFLTDFELLRFLSQSDVNVFLYDKFEGRGLSSVIDYALSVDVPIAINDSFMFRHIQNEKSNVAKNSLRQIINNGTKHLQQYKEKWSNENLIKKYEDILDKTL